METLLIINLKSVIDLYDDFYSFADGETSAYIYDFSRMLDLKNKTLS